MPRSVGAISVIASAPRRMLGAAVQSPPSPVSIAGSTSSVLQPSASGRPARHVAISTVAAMGANGFRDGLGLDRDRREDEDAVRSTIKVWRTAAVGRVGREVERGARSRGPAGSRRDRAAHGSDDALGDGKPRPVPPCVRVERGRPARTRRRCARCARSEARAGVEDEKRSSRLSVVGLGQRHQHAAGSVNLIALPIRLSSTWRTRPGSALTSSAPRGHGAAEAEPFARPSARAARRHRRRSRAARSAAAPASNAGLDLGEVEQTSISASGARPRSKPRRHRGAVPAPARCRRGAWPCP